MLRRSFLIAVPANLAFGGGARAAFAPGDAVQLRVRAGGGDLDAAVYEAVFEPFGAVMPLSRRPPFTATLDVTFSTIGHDWMGNHGAAATARSEDHWYVGDGAPPSAEVARGIKWQTSRMHVVLRPPSGTPSWSADYDYDGGLELSGWTVKTPAQAARLIARRLAARYRAKAG